MSDNAARKPKLPPPPLRVKEATGANLPNQTETQKEGTSGEQLPPPPPPSRSFGTQPGLKRDATQSGVSNSDRTTVTNIQENTITRVPGRIVPILQVSAGAEQGRILSLSQYKQLTVGRSKSCELVVYDPSCSRQHAEFRLGPDLRVAVKDLGSTNGTKVNGKRIRGEELFLNDGDRVQLGDSTVLRFTLMPEEDALAQINVYYRATRDALTNAFNRHQFDEAFNREISYQKRAGHGLGLILFDVDHFKRVNDGFGHPAGDEVLRQIGNRVPTCIRNEDIFARLGGEEFGVLARSENTEGINILAERIRTAMERKAAVFEGKEMWFTVSVGSAYISGGSAVTAAALMQCADDALYEAKNGGRNRCVLRTPTVTPPGSTPDKD